VIIDPTNLSTVFVSPRQRAHKTFHLLFGHLPQFPHHILTEEVREWDYGNRYSPSRISRIHQNPSGQYEGLLSSEIKKNNPSWSIWEDG
jgi:sedoheptulose-bisphosphatase